MTVNNKSLSFFGLLLASTLFFLISSPSMALSQMAGGQFSRLSRIMMGTSVEMVITQANPEKAEEAMEDAFREVQRIDLLMSNYREDSDVSRANRNAGEKETRVSGDTLRVVERALEFSSLSAGALDITLSPVFRLWNFRVGKIPDGRKLAENLKKVDYRKLKVDRAASSIFLEERGMSFDLGAIGKGYAVDRACEALLRNGIKNFLVNAGGHLKSHGRKDSGVPWVFGIQHPRLSSGVIFRLRPREGAVVTSGDYEKFFLKDGERYHHILNPATGMPARDCQSVTILAPSALDADALATAVFVLGPPKGLALIEKFPNVHALIVDHQGSVLLSPRWPEGILLPP